MLITPTEMTSVVDAYKLDQMTDSTTAQPPPADQPVGACRITSTPPRVSIHIHKITTFVGRASDPASTPIYTHLMLRCCSLHDSKDVTVSTPIHYIRSRIFVTIRIRTRNHYGITRRPL